MIIKIPDKIKGEQRRREVIIQQVKYAILKFRCKTKAARFLGYSRRVITDWINRYPELEVYKGVRF